MEFQCPHCLATLSVEDGFSGMDVECPVCDKTVPAPGVPSIVIPTKKRKGVTLRWIAVLPGAILAGALTHFPVHWATLVLYFFWGQDENRPLLSRISARHFEYFGVALFVPFTMITVGAWIAPRLKMQTGIALSVLIGILSVLAFFILQIAFPEYSDPARNTISVALNAVGIWWGIARLRKQNWELQTP